MPIYKEVVSQIHRLTKAEQFQLLEELKAIVENSIEAETEEELISPAEIAASETAWQDYLAGRDRGKSLQELELELFGRKLE
ncbi:MULTISPECIES: hypothetical protein [unclassified Okeania]|uniref:hypothetical protein n=1 Tax=unclassified Okeania TaxID=2634635 RepID=UPI0013BA0025|nr:MULTISPECIES: hypothetical protein [unclassified Okeania]NEP40594.1 hypothetical protein [Okeania sp. SIO2H7]NET15509.1 hypothetical protein [Okeania sp. SIO1H6]NEP72271.1 hypothetical protein [Okeania sp. SIO2G5]NEP96250.1 hypothetical protein [Okeania sp. SIO2F5]NEQ90550.1 hypothetical protein [Okeania sp. SIO2G4]